MKRKAPDPREAAKRAAINALRRARRAADKAGVKLSDWEGEFLGSVEQRVKTYGRAFADPDKGAADIVSPGHVFPLMARDGGVLVRAGHTEAAVDIARLAGLNPDRKSVV